METIHSNFKYFLLSYLAATTLLRTAIQLQVVLQEMWQAVSIILSCNYGGGGEGLQYPMIVIAFYTMGLIKTNKKDTLQQRKHTVKQCI